MNPSSAVKQAMALLCERREEAHVQMAQLHGEIAQIDRALSSLEHIETPHPALDASLQSDNTAASQGPSDQFDGLNVTAATRLLLEAERGPWTPSLVRQRLAGTSVQGDRSDATFIAAIRTAFHSLRQRELIATDQHNKTMARPWIVPTNAGPPVSAGGPGGNTLPNQEGGNSHEDESASTAPSSAEHQFHAQLGAPITGFAS